MSFQYIGLDDATLMDKILPTAKRVAAKTRSYAVLHEYQEGVYVDQTDGAKGLRVATDEPFAAVDEFGEIAGRGPGAPMRRAAIEEGRFRPT
jgi:hypothetical protein